MRKLTALSFTIAGMLLAMSACSHKRVHLDDPKDGAKYLQVTSGINGLRAYDNQWESGDAIGLFATELSATNAKFTTQESGASVDFTTATPVEIPYSSDNKEYAVKAYYPYAELSATNELTLTLPSAKPLLFAKGKVSHNQPTLTALFEHQLPEIYVVVSGSEKITIAKTGTATLKSVSTSAKVTLPDGTPTPVGDKSDAQLLTKKELANNSFHLYGFLLPGENLTNRDLTITVRVGTEGRSYTVSLPESDTSGAIEKGKRYLYNININEVEAKPTTFSAATIQAVTVEESTIEAKLPNGATPTPAEESLTVVLKETMTFSAEAVESHEVKVETNATEWTATSEATWIKIQKKTDGFTVTAKKYEDTTKDRTAKILIKAGTKTHQITVTQTKATPTTVSTPSIPTGTGSKSNPYNIAKARTINKGTGKWIRIYFRQYR